MTRRRIFLIVSSVITLIVVMLSVLAVVESRNKNIPKISNSLFSKETDCEMPCWNNITPGLTSREEALLILKKSDMISKNSIKTTGSYELGAFSWLWLVNGSQGHSWIQWQNGVVNGINLFVPFDMTTQFIIDTYGNPKYIALTDSGIPEQWYWILSMYYSQKGFQVSVQLDDFEYQFGPLLMVEHIRFFSPTTDEKRFSDFYYPLDWELVSELMQPWNGFGDIREIYNTTIFHR